MKTLNNFFRRDILLSQTCAIMREVKNEKNMPSNRKDGHDSSPKNGLQPHFQLFTPTGHFLQIAERNPKSKTKMIVIEKIRNLNFVGVKNLFIKNFLPPKLKYGSNRCFSPGSFAVSSGAARGSFRQTAWRDSSKSVLIYQLDGLRRVFWRGTPTPFGTRSLPAGRLSLVRQKDRRDLSNHSADLLDGPRRAVWRARLYHSNSMKAPASRGS